MILGYNYRAGDYKLALQDWAGASAVLKGYRDKNYLIQIRRIKCFFGDLDNLLLPSFLIALYKKREIDYLIKN